MNMEINLNNRMTAGIGAGSDMAGVQGADQAKGASDASRTARMTPGVTISRANASPEEIQAAAIPESALRRDDALGNLIGRAFNLPPPPMPSLVG